MCNLHIKLSAMAPTVVSKRTVKATDAIGKSTRAWFQPAGIDDYGVASAKANILVSHHHMSLFLFEVSTASDAL